jgi:hypothetical protein
MRVREIYCELEVFDTPQPDGSRLPTLRAELTGLKADLERRGERMPGLGRPEEHAPVMEGWFEQFRVEEGGINHQGPYLFRRYVDRQTVYFNSWLHSEDEYLASLLGDGGRGRELNRAERIAAAISRRYPDATITLHFESADHSLEGALAYRGGHRVRRR